MKFLNQILANTEFTSTASDLQVQVKSIAFDSRKVENGYLFVAIKGEQVDGHNFIEKAIEKGAIAIVCDKNHKKTYENVIQVFVEDTSETLGVLASEFYDKPSENLKLIGITGTNGKTTTATILFEVFRKLGYKVGLLSTIKNLINDKEIPATHTTPDALSFNILLQEMVNEACEYCFVEVSSHAVVQNRIAGLYFAGGVFTNITHDHLDYHKTFKEYIKAKKLFFDNLPKNAFALTNIDDKNGNIVLQNTKAKKYTYAINNFSDFNTKIIENLFEGMLLTFDNNEVWTRLTGKFNAYNLLAVYSVAVLLGEEKQNVLTQISAITPVKGRFEAVTINKKTAIIDYAHTPDALENVLKTINDIRNENQNLITVVGAGGDRDKTKRPIMAKTAVNFSSKVILTSDNPRTENPEAIINEMYAGISGENQAKVLKITSREEAIKLAVMLAQENDIILIAGKGHEDYQEINRIKTHFDDKEMIEKYLK